MKKVAEHFFFFFLAHHQPLNCLKPSKLLAYKSVLRRHSTQAEKEETEFNFSDDIPSLSIPTYHETENLNLNIH